LIASIGRTVAASLPDVFHLAMILAVLFENFCMAGYLIFGSELKEWSTVNLAHRSALGMWSGQGDFAAMYNLYPVSAVCWLFTFVLAIVFLASNMVLAVMVDHFTDIKAEVGQGEQHIFQQAVLLFFDAYWKAGFQLRQFIRITKEKAPSVGAKLPYVDDIETRVTEVPYDALLDALDPCQSEVEKSDPLSHVKNPPNETKFQMPAWVREKPGWAQIDMEVLTACGCDDDTAEHLLDKCMRLMKGRRPDYFPAAIMYHEFEGNMRNMYEQLDATSEDVQNWLRSRRADCENMEPRQRKLESLANEQILPRPDEDHPMLMPLSPEDHFAEAMNEDLDEDDGDDESRHMLED